MTNRMVYQGYQEEFEYHGNTAVERVRRQNGQVARDWLYFDTAEDAADFYFESCACCEAA